MAGELKHTSPGIGFESAAEYTGIGVHILDGQAIGDLIYASSILQLSKLGIGAASTILSSQGGIPSWRTPANILADLSGQAGADFSMNTHKITNVTDPASAQDAVTKNYIDTRIKTVKKSADETVNNSTTLQADDELLFAMEANKAYEIFQLVRYTSSAVADIKFSRSYPSGAACLGGTCYYYNGAWVWIDLMSADPISAAGVGAPVPQIYLRTIISNGATPGNYVFTWAQNTAEVSDTIVKANSTLLAFRIG